MDFNFILNGLKKEILIDQDIYNSSLSGVINFVDSDKGCAIFSINKQEKLYYFSPTDSLHSYILDNMLMIDDSIYKNANNDKLYIFHGDTIFKCFLLPPR